MVNNIRRVRRGKDVTQRELAKRIGVTCTTVNRWEKGHRSPSLESAAKIARALNCKIEDLVTEEA